MDRFSAVRPYDISKVDFHEQSAEERYGIPENFLEIEVRSPITHGFGRKQVFYKIIFLFYFKYLNYTHKKKKKKKKEFLYDINLF